MNHFKEKLKEFKQIASDMRFMLGTTWKYDKCYLLLTVLLCGGVFYPLSNLVRVVSVKMIINAITNQQSPLNIVFLLLLLEGTTLLITVLDSAFSEFYRNKKQLQINAKINKELFDKTIHTDFRFFDTPDYYDSYAYAANQYASNAEAAVLWLVDLTQAFFSIVVLIAVALSNDVIVLICVLVSLILSTMVSEKGNKLGESIHIDNIPLNRKRFYSAQLFYTREASMEQKCTRLPVYSYEMYDNATKKKEGLIDKYKYRKFVISSAGGIVETLFNVGVSVYLVYCTVVDRITIGDFAGYLAAASCLKSCLGAFFGSYSKAHKYSVYARQIRHFTESKSVIESKVDGEPVPNGSFDFEMKDVSFSYDNSSFSLKNINIHARPGEQIAIVGENGAGKTTLAKLLLRLYNPTSGSILINGRSISDYRLYDLRLKTGTAFQKTCVYTMSFIKNLSLYKELSESEAEMVSKSLGLDKVLERNHAGYQSQIGREFDGKGIILSGGEAQKVGLARVFAANFGLMILDEPTSSLDPIAEYDFNKALLSRKNRTTTIIVSHRLSTIRDVDRIYLISNGMVVEEGTHHELMEKHGKYREMFEKQAEAYKVC